MRATDPIGVVDAAHRCAGLFCVALCAATSACTLLPVRPSDPALPVAGTELAFKVTIAPEALTTSGDLPAAGTAKHVMLASHVAGQLNVMIGASERAAVKLPTTVALNHRKGSKDREELRIRLETRLPSGESVDTFITTPWIPPAKTPFVASPACGLGCLPLLGGVSVPGFGCAAMTPLCALAGNPTGLALACAVGSLVATALTALVVAAVLGVQAARLESARTTALSNGLQRAMHMHALDVRRHLSGRHRPAPRVAPQEVESKREIDVDAPGVPTDAPAVPVDPADPVDPVDPAEAPPP